MPALRTVVFPVRITTTQRALLKTPKYYGKAGAIFRAILTLYLNGHLAPLGIEELIQKELGAATARQDATKFTTKVTIP